jgi:hypothetical protein
VIGADEKPRVALRLGAHLGAAVATDVEHRVDGPVRRTRQDDLLVAQSEKFEIARVRDDARMRQTMPVAAKQPLHVPLEDSGIHVERARKAVAGAV